MDKAATIRALREEIKTKDEEIACLTARKRLGTEEERTVFISIAEEIGDNVMKARPHLEPK
ncbi:hypothetical protein KI387_032761, partial [Taxus chinensis]